MRIAALAAGLSTLALAATAAAQPAPPAPAPTPTVTTDDEPVRSMAAGEDLSYVGGDVRDNLRDWAVGPPGWDVGGEMVFITSDQGLAAGRRLDMTDIGIIRARVRYTASRRIELAASVDALAKQPAYSDELPFQGASGVMKVAITRNWALTTAVSGGPTLHDPTSGTGMWGAGSTAMVYRHHPHETLSFEVHGGAIGTAVRTDAMRPWLAEVDAGGRVMLHSPNGWFGSWAGADLAVPIVHDGPIDPSTRLDLVLGMAYAVVDNWDLYVEGSIRDRGETDLPATQLPILDGGFDQRQLVVGVVRRFDGKKDDHSRDDFVLAQ